MVEHETKDAANIIIAIIVINCLFIWFSPVSRYHHSPI